MLLNILLFLLGFLNVHARRIPDEHRWNIKYMSNTNGDEFDRVINGYDFDQSPFEEDVPFNICYTGSQPDIVRPLSNYSGYVFCTDVRKGIVQRCPPGTELSYQFGGCVNQTTNTTIFPIGSRCASQPCQSGGRCYDFPSADGYLCQCTYPYVGLHCHVRVKRSLGCGGNVGNITTSTHIYTTDKALDHTCICYNLTSRPATSRYAMNNCYADELFDLKCDEKSRVFALPFSNKGYYICPFSVGIGHIGSCPLHHVWNDTKKECVFENN